MLLHLLNSFLNILDHDLHLHNIFVLALSPCKQVSTTVRTTSPKHMTLQLGLQALLGCLIVSFDF